MGRSYDKTRSNFEELMMPVLRLFRAGCEAEKLTLVRFSVPDLIIPFTYANAAKLASYFAIFPKWIDVWSL